MDSKGSDINQTAEREVSAEADQYLIFREGKFSLALWINSIKKLYDTETPPPRTRETRMLDLKQLTGSGSSAANNYWIELEVRDKKYLMPIEQVEGIRELSLAVVMDYPGVLVKPETRFLRRMFFDGLRMIVELDPEGLAQIAEAETDTIGLGARTSRPEPEAEKPDQEVPDKNGSKGDRILLFEAGNELWGLPLDKVVQVVNKEDVHFVPTICSCVEGVVYHAEQAVPLMAPQSLIRIALDKESEPEDFPMIMLADTRRGMVGFGCKRILEVVEKLGAESKVNLIDLEKIVSALSDSV